MVRPYEGIREIFACGIRGILGFGIRNTAQGIRNPTNEWNPESKFNRHKIGGQFLESGIFSVESKTVLNSLIWGENGRGNNKKLSAMTSSEQNGI